MRLGVLFLTVAVTLITACSGRPSAPIYDRSANRHQRAAESSSAIRIPSYYVVRPGDTLYAIAFRYGLDFKTVAHWNDIPPPYTIYAEQRLRLSRPRNQPRVAERSPQKTPEPAVTTRPRQPPPQGTPKTGQPAASTPPRVATPQATTAAPPRPVTTQTVPIPGQPVWQWPTEGTIIKRFSAADESSRGIDIAVDEGQQVRAAAAGEVVYSGRGLIGYGELIIIKHNQSYLSAYGNNKTRLISEGDRVEAGQAIATSGRSGSNRPMLHFEIRKNGKPVDPLDHLPR